MAKRFKDKTLHDYASRFVKLEDDKFLFHLWGVTGEAVYVNKKSKKHILVFLSFFYIFALSSAFIYLLLVQKELISVMASNCIMSITPIFLTITYIGYMYFLQKNMQLHTSPKHQQFYTKRVFFFWVASVGFQIPAWAVMFYRTYEIKDILFCTTGITYTLFITYFCIKLYKTKGHYFSA